MDEKRSAVQRMQDYIERHITEPITLIQLARVAGYSPWYSARAFKDLTGTSPFEYIRCLRLSKAALKLSGENTKVIDVAFDFVFDSHEGFTRAFSKYFGITPKEFRKRKPRLGVFIPRRIEKLSSNGDKIMSRKTNTVFIQVIDRPARKLILKRGIKATHYFEYCEEVSCDIWGVLGGVKDALYEPVGMWLPSNLVKPGTSIYAQGVEVPMSYSRSLPEGCDLIELPPCKFMIFQGQQYKDEDFEEEILELREVIASYNPEISGFQWADSDGPRFQLEPVGYRGYIEGRPVRQINAPAGPYNY
ncbi:MAG: transcriptional regulator [Bdellovibrionales bacterium RIFOXYD1_FULL_53_11]|nr:MAG: transcriptional regulator [Bdellovibrionales bacterium RIFOXYD1_FULL_53_11]